MGRHLDPRIVDSGICGGIDLDGTGPTLALKGTGKRFFTHTGVSMIPETLPCTLFPSSDSRTTASPSQTLEESSSDT